MKNHIKEKLDDFKKMQSKDWISYKGYNKSIALFFVLTVITLGLFYLNYIKYFTLPGPLVAVLRLLGIIVASYFIASVIVRLTAVHVVKLFEETIEAEHKILITKLYAMIIFLIATTVVLWKLGVTVENITIFAGLAATGIAFAIRDVILSYLAWFILLTKRPFKIGDYIKIGESEGVVQHVGTFYVIVDDSPERLEDFVRIPNKTFLEKPIINYGREKIPVSIRLKIDPIANEYEIKIEKIVQDIKKINGEQITPYLESEGEHIFIKVETRVHFSEKHKIKDAILRILIKHLAIDKKNL